MSVWAGPVDGMHYGRKIAARLEGGSGRVPRRNRCRLKKGRPANQAVRGIVDRPVVWHLGMVVEVRLTRSAIAGRPIALE